MVSNLLRIPKVIFLNPKALALIVSCGGKIITNILKLIMKIISIHFLHFAFQSFITHAYLIAYFMLYRKS